jgi:hypothetical protein
MLFNSISFAVFLPIVFLLYWFIFNRNLRLQNLFIVVASYIFYGWWDWRFLLLIMFTSFCSWISGILMQPIDNQGFTPPMATPVVKRIAAYKRQDHLNVQYSAEFSHFRRI